MYIGFASKKLKRDCEESKFRNKRWNKLGNKIVQRLNEIGASQNLAELLRQPGAKCHALSRDRDGQYAVKLNDNNRLIFEPLNNPSARTANGKLYLTKVTAVRIIDIKDYH